MTVVVGDRRACLNNQLDLDTIHHRNRTRITSAKGSHLWHPSRLGRMLGTGTNTRRQPLKWDSAAISESRACLHKFYSMHSTACGYSRIRDETSPFAHLVDTHMTRAPIITRLCYTFQQFYWTIE